MWATTLGPVRESESMRNTGLYFFVFLLFTLTKQLQPPLLQIFKRHVDEPEAFLKCSSILKNKASGALQSWASNRKRTVRRFHLGWCAHVSRYRDTDVELITEYSIIGVHAPAWSHLSIRIHFFLNIMHLTSDSSVI